MDGIQIPRRNAVYQIEFKENGRLVPEQVVLSRLSPWPSITDERDGRFRQSSALEP